MSLCTEGFTDEQRKEQWQLLYHINDNLYKAANNVSSKLYLDDHVSSMVRLKHADYLSLLRDLAKAEKQKTPDTDLIAELRDKLAAAEREMSDQELAICKYATEMSTQTLAYKFATEIEINVFGQILACLKQAAQSNYNSDAKDVKRGERAIRNYKKGMPIPFPWNDSLRIESEGSDFYLRWYNGIRFKMQFGKDRSNNRLIVSRCLKLDKDYDGDYKLCNSSLQLVKREGAVKLFLLLVVNIPQEQVELNKKIVVGVDLGVNVPAYVATNITEERKAIGDREHFLNTRMQFQRRYKSLQRLKTTAGGKGRTKKLEPLENYNLLTHQGSAISFSDLNAIKTGACDLFIAVTKSEARNILACSMAKRLGAKKTVARLDNDEFFSPKWREHIAHLGIDHLIYPEMLALRR